MPLRILSKILILSAVFLTIGFYVSINENNEDTILIKENNTSEIKEQNITQNPVNKPSKKIVSEKPKEGLALLIGKNEEELEKELGRPLRIDESTYGYQWYIYNQNPKGYLQVGVENKRIVTIFAIGQNLDVAPFEIGQPVEEIFNTHYIDTNVNLEYNGNSYRFELNDTDLNLRPMVQLGDIFVQLYIDKFTGNLSSVRFLDASTLIKQRPYELVYNGALIQVPEPSEEMQRKIEEDTEQEIFDITNVLRARNKLKVLKWDENAAKAAFQHSKDMSENNDFSHTSKKFGDLDKRLKTAEVVYKSAGENIAANYTDGPAVVEGWLNSKGHREALLNKDYSHLGVGVFEEYYTQNFIQKIEQ
ncbi:CAP domain-containing protein [Neobacillus sp. SuZ13]|uniref:CAP domain-containing protein n=1 Tax=Neobacillus sp. SuZ13 TaxID=3047875 RepID=UPI0024C042BF|nr:CAP domain-containing protein [Neobacillus sp. SuZ13]WHY68591.1 CAP domain-containing protein [Neobacillus sp. SuZ13]